jgi:hypothetical protein
VDRSHSEGRELQYREMMQTLQLFERKYKGVRGELLRRVRADFEKLRPQAGFERRPQMCSACGREMKPIADGRMRCMNGHIA